MRYVAFDLGDKRTGIAVGDRVTGLAMPLEVIEIPIELDEGNRLLDAIARHVEEQFGPRGSSTPGGWGSKRDEGEIVLGLPLNMDGTEGPRARLIRAWGERIAARCDRAVRYQDERLTSAAAEEVLDRSGLTHQQKKLRRDALAAVVILRDYLATLAQTPSDESP